MLGVPMHSNRDVTRVGKWRCDCSWPCWSWNHHDYSENSRADSHPQNCRLFINMATQAAFWDVTMPHVLVYGNFPAKHFLGFLERELSVTALAVWDDRAVILKKSSEVDAARALESCSELWTQYFHALIFSSPGCWRGARDIWKLIQKSASDKSEHHTRSLSAGVTFPVVPGCLQPQAVLSPVHGILCFFMHILVCAWSISQVSALAAFLITAAKYLTRSNLREKYFILVCGWKGWRPRWCARHGRVHSNGSLGL